MGRVSIQYINHLVIINITACFRDMERVVYVTRLCQGRFPEDWTSKLDLEG